MTGRTPTPKSRPRSAPLRAGHDSMLDAAESVVIRDGIGKLTLDAVAREARLSKGGLLHHFPTKESLIDALVHRNVAAWRADCEAAIAAQPAGPGKVPRAFLSACLSSADHWTETVRRRGLVLVAALVHDPSRVAPLQRFHRELSARIADDGLPAGVGEAVQLAVDGLWFDWLFGLTELTPQKLAAVRAALRGLVEQSCPRAIALPATPAVAPGPAAADRRRARASDTASRAKTPPAPSPAASSPRAVSPPRGAVAPTPARAAQPQPTSPATRSPRGRRS